MKSKYPLFLIAIIFLTGCASAQLSKNILEFSITPDKGIKAGTIVTVIVKATEDTDKVYGSLDMIGSPRIPLKFDQKRKVWFFKQMVPMVSIPQGEYTVRIEAESKSGDRSVSEKKVSTY